MTTIYPKYSKKREGVNVTGEQRLLQQVSDLILNAEVCTGCGVCVEACPEDAIAIGLVGATKRGVVEYAAPYSGFHDLSLAWQIRYHFLCGVK